MANEDIIIQCECGKVWAMDFQPAPEECLESNWRLRAGDFWGVWVDKDGNEVQVEEEPGSEDGLSEVREQESFGGS